MSDAEVQRQRTEAYQQEVDEVLLALGTDERRGLSDGEARARLERYGKNDLTAEKPVPAWKKFLAQFQDVLVILLLAATLVSAGLWLYERESILPYEAIAIFAIVLLNAVMGYFQESRAEASVAALRQMSAAHANVIRNGQRQSIPAAEVVPGDILLIEEGDTIPADARLIQSTALQTAEAALTGESLPVAKDTLALTEKVGLGDRHNMIFSGTAATYGRGRAAVTATGMETQMGLIAGMLKEAPAETTPLQKELARVGKLLGLIVVSIAVVMIATIILVEEVRGFSAIFEVLILGVALAVAAVPEGVPAVVTAVLSLGVQRMAKRNAIVLHLAAVEEGRAIFSNIRKFLRYLLSSNIGEVMTMFFGVLLADRIGLKAEGSGVVLPLLATQILWINLVTDGAPALALGVDSGDARVMTNGPRPRVEGVITGRMWAGIFFVGVVTAAGTLLVLDWSLPGGLIEGSGNMRYAQTMTFTTLMLFQLFNVFNARSDERSAFSGLFNNHWLWGAIVLSLVLHGAVVYIPFMQQAFSTVSLSARDWLRCMAVASSVLWLCELSKVATRATANRAVAL